MAEGINKVILLGNLGQNPELRYTQNGHPVLSLRMATNERFKNRDGEWQDRTEWHNVTVWGKRAEGLNRVIGKGTQIYVEGRLQTRSWEDKQGQKRYTTEVVAREIVLLGRGRGADNRARPSADDEYRGGRHEGGVSDEGYGGPSGEPDADDFSDDDTLF